MKTTEIKPLDLSIFKDFKFVPAVGDYHDKQVCIMSALYLATQIALGKTTLEDAILSRDERDEIEGETGQDVKRFYATDQVDCVSGYIRDVCISRNDENVGVDKRKEWALSMMPKIVDTYRGQKFEERISYIANRFDAFNFLVKYKPKLEQLVASSPPNSKLGRRWRSDLRETESLLALREEGGFSPDPLDDSWSTSLRLAFEDAKIEAMAAFSHAERDRRDRSNAARRAKRSRISKGASR